MSELLFKEWPKIARLFRDIVVTEKIDGTNAAVQIQEFPFGALAYYKGPHRAVSGTVNSESGIPDVEYLVGAQSRKRVITKDDDNFGFAAWVHENAEGLVNALGKGIHFGEWWGSGIQRGYGRMNGVRQFSLFNTKKWRDQQDFLTWPIGLDVVPVLYEGPFRSGTVDHCLWELKTHGSWAAPGYMKPEGVVVFHTAANEMFKATIENDESPKALAA